MQKFGGNFSVKVQYFKRDCKFVVLKKILGVWNTPSPIINTPLIIGNKL